MIQEPYIGSNDDIIYYDQLNQEFIHNLKIPQDEDVIYVNLEFNDNPSDTLINIAIVDLNCCFENISSTDEGEAVTTSSDGGEDVILLIAISVIFCSILACIIGFCLWKDAI